MNKKNWMNRISSRSDFTAGLVHLTKKSDSATAFDNFMNILIQGCIVGSTTDTGYICGDIPAVCFQDMPLHSLAENINYEQKQKKDSAHVRYSGFGFRFSKEFIYNNGGRPVIYDKTQDAKSYLKKEDYWRIVNFDLSCADSYIDWMHEREWRVPNNLKFNLSDVEILLHDVKAYKKFIRKCREITDVDILLDVKSIIVLPSLIF